MDVVLDRISKIFPGLGGCGSVEVLKDFSCSIYGGSLLSIVGPSGCGKTTILRIIAGLERASSGRVIFGMGEAKPEGKPLVGLVFQDYALFPWRTTLGNITAGLEFMGVPLKERLAKGMEYVSTFGLDGFENRYPKELSGGMKQRVAIARTLIMEPGVVLMDEPFGSLDSQTRNLMQEFLAGLWEKRRDTIIFVTHNVDEAVFLSDDIIVLTSRPARVIERVKVSCKRPRDRTGIECNTIRRSVLDVLGRESSKSG